MDDCWELAVLVMHIDSDHHEMQEEFLGMVELLVARVQKPTGCSRNKKSFYIKIKTD